MAKKGLGTARLSHMTYTGMKAACIMRGMPFEEVAENDFWGLSRWYYQHSHEKCNKELLEDFQQWRKLSLIHDGYSPDDALVNFSEYATDENNAGGRLKSSVVHKAAMGRLKKERPKKERDQTFGILKGTKKSKIFELTEKAYNKGWDKKKCLRKILELCEKKKYDIAPKSIGIWFKKAYKQLESKKSE